MQSKKIIRTLLTLVIITAILASVHFFIQTASEKFQRYHINGKNLPPAATISIDIIYSTPHPLCALEHDAHQHNGLHKTSMVNYHVKTSPTGTLNYSFPVHALDPGPCNWQPNELKVYYQRHVIFSHNLAKNAVRRITVVPHLPKQTQDQNS